MNNRQTSVSAYPLAWPDGWKRTKGYDRQNARFSKGHEAVTIAEATRRLLAALKLFGVADFNAIISTNLLRRNNGLPRSGQPEPSDPGAAVYWVKRSGGQQKVMAIDQYDRVADNIAALAATLNAMRSIERYGGAEILDRSFMGFAALPAPVPRSWRAVLGFDAFEALDICRVESRFRELAKIHHPDAGGDADRFHEIVAARDAATKEL